MAAQDIAGWSSPVDNQHSWLVLCQSSVGLSHSLHAPAPQKCANTLTEPPAMSTTPPISPPRDGAQCRHESSLPFPEEFVSCHHSGH